MSWKVKWNFYHPLKDPFLAEQIYTAVLHDGDNCDRKRASLLERRQHDYFHHHTIMCNVSWAFLHCISSACQFMLQQVTDQSIMMRRSANLIQISVELNVYLHMQMDFKRLLFTPFLCISCCALASKPSPTPIPAFCTVCLWKFGLLKSTLRLLGSFRCSLLSSVCESVFLNLSLPPLDLWIPL